MKQNNERIDRSFNTDFDDVRYVEHDVPSREHFEKHMNGAYELNMEENYNIDVKVLKDGEEEFLVELEHKPSRRWKKEFPWEEIHYLAKKTHNYTEEEIKRGVPAFYLFYNYDFSVCLICRFSDIDTSNGWEKFGKDDAKVYKNTLDKAYVIHAEDLPFFFSWYLAWGSAPEHILINKAGAIK